jgi:hypothetical protein
MLNIIPTVVGIIQIAMLLIQISPNAPQLVRLNLAALLIDLTGCIFLNHSIRIEEEL